MKPVLTNELKNRILDGNWPKGTPFRRKKDGTAYLKADSFCIKRNAVIFYWKDVPLYEFHHNADFGIGDTLTVTSIDTRMKFEMEL